MCLFIVILALYYRIKSLSAFFFFFFFGTYVVIVLSVQHVAHLNAKVLLKKALLSAVVLASLLFGRGINLNF